MINFHTNWNHGLKNNLIGPKYRGTDTDIVIRINSRIKASDWILSNVGKQAKGDEYLQFDQKVYKYANLHSVCPKSDIAT